MASSIVKSAAQQLGNILVDEATYLYKVRDKIESLQTELEWAECFLRDADAQQHQDRIVCKWVSQVRDFAYDGEDIIEKYLHEVSHHRRDGIRNTLKWFSCILWTCDAWTLHNLGSEIDNLTFKMSELTKRLRRYGIQIIRPTRSLEYNREEWRTYSHTEEDVVGLKDDIKQVVDRLVNTEVKVVAISGIGGLGKSTLARKVFKHKDIKDFFNDNCAWVYISKEFESKKIFQEILSQLDKGEEARKMNKKPQKVEELPEEINNDAMRTEELAEERNNDAKRTEQLPEAIINKLLQEKKCLVVVDDIWTEKAWKNLKPAFESILRSSSRSKILLTTRNQDLLRKHVDRSGYPHLLSSLSDDDSWELLKRKAFIGVHGSTGGESSTSGQHNISQNEPPDAAKAKKMEKLGKEMLKHCNGLPIAIVVLGGILSTRNTTSEWEDVEKNISSYLMGGIEEGGGEDGKPIFKVLELSYHDLPFYLKPCFLYLGNFPEDYQISTQRLYHLWEAEGLLTIEGEAKKKRGTSYDIGERYLNELVQRSMVQMGECWTTGRIKTCRVHDVMRDMCLIKCEEVSFLHHIKCTTSSDVASTMPVLSNEIKKLRRCALYDENGDCLDTCFQNGERPIGIRSLLVFQSMNQGTLEKIWKAFPLLRVLDLQDTDIHSVDGVGHLIHLRYLSLRNSEVEVLPLRLYDLKYLETLDLRCGWSEIKLCDEFYKMKRLRHLYLPRKFQVKGDKKLTFPKGGQMETIKNFDPERCETQELMQMTNLRVFSVTRGYNIFKKAEELKGVVDAPVMKKAGQLINTCRMQISLDVIKEKPGNGITSDEESRPAHNPSLTRVEQDKYDTIGDLLLGLENLPTLHVLHLRGSTIGEATIKMSLSPGSFPQLTELRVKYPMRSFEWEVGEAAAPNLQLLVLHKCENLNKLKNIPNSLTQVKLWRCGITEGEVSALEKLPHLKSLRVQGEVGNKLSFSAVSFPQLTELCLEEQTELEEWEVGEGALANLRSLKLKGWNKLKKVVNKLPDSLTEVELMDCEIGEGGVSFFSCLEKLPCIRKLKIDTLVRSGGDNKLSFSPGSFPQLTELHLKWHPEWEEWEVADGALPNLQQLTLSGWKRLNKLNNLSNSLTRVDLWQCEIGEAAGGSLLLALENLPCLQQLHLLHCEIGGGGNKMSFSPGSFLHLTKLHIFQPKQLEKWEWEVGDGALPNLQNLKLYGCFKLKKIPNPGLPASVHIECDRPCIKGIEKYNTCPHFKKGGQVKSRWRSKPMRWLHDSCA